MKHQSTPIHAPSDADPGEQVAQLRHVLRLVEEIAGRPPSESRDAALDEAARISSHYASALPIVQRRFDMLVAETAAWAAAGVEALLVVQHRQQAPAAAASRLADALVRALKRLAEILRV